MTKAENSMYNDNGLSDHLSGPVSLYIILHQYSFKIHVLYFKIYNCSNFVVSPIWCCSSEILWSVRQIFPVHQTKCPVKSVNLL